jgi:hypothetical protein
VGYRNLSTPATRVRCRPTSRIRQEQPMTISLVVMICIRLGYVPGWMRRLRAVSVAIPQPEGNTGN